MSSFIYDLALQGFLEGSFDMATADVKVLLVQTSGGYTPNQATDQYVSIIGSGNIASRTPQLTSVVTTDGIFGAANTSFTSVSSGPACGALVMYIDSGSDSTSPLIAFMDSTDYSGLPITPNGGNITVAWPTGADLIFSL